MGTLIKIFVLGTVVTLSVGVIFDNCARGGAEEADKNQDGVIDCRDLIILVANWLQVQSSDPNDYDGLQEYAVLAANWQKNLSMVYIPGGEVLIGDHSTIRDPANPIGWGEERPVHAVYINSFYIGRGEMTNQEYCDFLNHADVKVVVGSAHGDIVYAASDDSNSRPYTPVSPLGADSMIAYNDGDGTFSLRTREGQEMGDFPIVELSWYGAAAYCNWRSVYEGYEPCYNLSTWECDFTKNGYRLPTEHEWEYAARGGLHNPYYDYPWPSNSIDFSKANYGNINNQPINNPRGWSIHPYLTKAGDYSPNGYGLFDMAGNTWEWCNDWYSYQYNNVPYDNPTGPAISPYGHRVVRGSCWQRSGFYCRVSCRTGSGFVPDFMDNRMGFRIARPF